MLKYLLNYPIKAYVKALFKPKGKGPTTGYYFSQDKNMIFVQGGKPNTCQGWRSQLRGYIGAPSLAQICRSEMEMGNPHVPSSFRKEVGLPLKLQNGNDTHVVIEDPDLFLGLATKEEYTTVASIKKALGEDPSDIIALWNSYSSKGDYAWELLDLSFRTMDDSETLPEKFFLVGYPEEKIQAICRWSTLYSNNVINLLPAPVLVAKMAMDEERKLPPVEGDDSPPRGTFFLLYAGETETYISYFTRGQCLIFAPQKTRTGFNPNETLQEIEDIREQEDLKKSTPIRIWGVKEDDNLLECLESEGWTSVKNYDPKTLSAEDPIILEGKPEAHNFEFPEPWLLKFAMK